MKSFGWDGAKKIDQDIATEIIYNVGSLKNYNNFKQRFKEGNTEKLLKENNRSYKDKNGNRIQLKYRQELIKKAAEQQKKMDQKY